MDDQTNEKRSRAASGESSVYYGADGYWHGRVTVGQQDDGSSDRRHIRRKADERGADDDRTKAAVEKAVRKIEQERDYGRIRKAGQIPTVEAWLAEWLEIVRPTLKYKAYTAYKTAVGRHLTPGLGKWRVTKVEPHHLEKLYAKLLKSKLKPGTVHQVHRTARTAFGEAERRGIITKNPAALAKPPRVDEEEIEPFEVEEIQRLIKTSLERRNGVRFVLALALGTRQGETIGLKWGRLNDRTKLLTIAKQLQRQTWEHGCDDPNKCGDKYHKRKPCPDGCKRHKRKPCPPPCSPNCTDHARWCAKRQGGGLVEVEVKSRAGRRGIVLPDPLYKLLEQHREQQKAERERAAELWEEGGWMFAQPNGRPLDPRRDYDEWLALLADAGVRTARLHDARHTAATVLLLLEVPERAVMELMGWSHSSMAKRYQHVTAALRATIAKRVGGFLWGED